MSVTTLKKLSATVLAIILLFTNNAGASELRLGMAEKQQYIENKIHSTLHPASDFKPYKFEATEGWTLEKLTLNNVDVERLKAEHPKTDRVILQFHGGGYTNGLTEGHRLLGAKQGMLIGASEVYYVHYRLAPKNVYPAALDDAVAVYKALLSSGIKPENIIFIGDSAGGNLALELSLYLKENGLSQPAALALISPWGTFEQNATSRIKNRDRDLVLGSKGFPLYREVQVIKPSYAGDMELNDSKLSPIYADLRGLPPMLIQVGGYELFVDDGLSLLNRALSDDVEATLTTYPGMPHDFPLLLPELYETELSLKEFRDFVERYL
ncbi:MAG: alpha/beta hydrolase [Synergistaceae bacterium]|nr:alpha/beta hydrolase [Synergistaceae bacterium]